MAEGEVANGDCASQAIRQSPALVEFATVPPGSLSLASFLSLGLYFLSLDSWGSQGLSSLSLPVSSLCLLSPQASHFGH